MLHHNLSCDDVRGRLILWTPKGIKIAEMGDDRRVCVGELETQLRALIHKYKIDLVSIDPFVKAHGVEENDNNAIDAVCTLLARLATEMRCAVDIIHHDAKGVAEPGNPNRGRGASAWRDAARLIYTLTGMSADEAAQFNIADAERRSLVRLDSAKINIAPSASEARWFRLVGVKLGNGTPDYPHGDEVQTVEPWDPPNFWALLNTALANSILDKIEAGTESGRRYTGSPQAKPDRAAWALVKTVVPDLSEAQSRAVIATWLKNGVVETRPSRDPGKGREETGLFVNPAKRPS